MDLSARWLLTVLCGIAFMELVFASIIARFYSVEPLLTGTEIMAILMPSVDSSICQPSWKGSE